MENSTPELISELNRHALFQSLSDASKDSIVKLSSLFSLTFQEQKFLVELACDLKLWQEDSFGAIVDPYLRSTNIAFTREEKKKFINYLKSHRQSVSSKPKSYDIAKGQNLTKPTLNFVQSTSDKNILGLCPVASEKTVCCNLKTLDAVENCAYGCSYCTIQTFYGDNVNFHKDLKSKLNNIKLDPNRYYHIGTGQSSDSLVWGNKYNVLSDLCDFAVNNPNVLLEFKTKSANISYFLKEQPPNNIVCSWTINTPTIIENEEHFTASLESRLDAAFKLASHGVKIAFHFHPMVYYDNWKEDYLQVVNTILSRFDPKTILFISIGSVTFIKPVLKQIRRRGTLTKITQMEMIPDPHGRLTYPDEIKLQQFNLLYNAFTNWHSKVFFYLCMEKETLWDDVFGFHFETNELFEYTFGKEMQKKISSFNFLNFDQSTFCIGK